MKIDQGFFKIGFTDHHAILGIAVDTDPKQVRKRYLKIARKLHPDSLSSASDADKQQASEILSKLVNPAYEKLSQDRDAAEHALILKQRGQQLSAQLNSLAPTTDAAKELLTTNNLDHVYTTSVQALANQQYDSLDGILGMIGQISELNMVYVARRAASGAPAAPRPAAPPARGAAATASTGSATAPPPPPAPPPTRRESLLDSYLNRAKEYTATGNYSLAIKELREALSSNPNSAACHSQLADIYLKAKQPTMAKVHLKRALEIDPKDKAALEIEKQLGKSGQASGGKGSASKGDNSKGGLFGLFGGKKK